MTKENPECSVWSFSCMGISRTHKENPTFFRVDSHFSQIHVKQFYKKSFIPLIQELPSTELHAYAGVARLVTRQFCCTRKLISTKMTKISNLFKFEHL